MEYFKHFTQECSNDIGLTLIFYGKVILSYQAFRGKEFMDYVQYFDA